MTDSTERDRAKSVALHVSKQDATAMQKKAFTRWVNTHLDDRGMEAKDLYEDLQDGLKLINLMEIISSKTIAKYVKQPKLQIHKTENLGKALQLIKDEGIKLVNIGAGDIEAGNATCILGLIWTLILRYQIMKGKKGDAGGSAKQEMLAWVNTVIAPLKAGNLNKDWQDGKLLSAVLNGVAPGAHSPTGDAVKDIEDIITHAKEKLDIPRLLDAHDVVDGADEHAMLTYLSYFQSAQTAAKEKRVDPVRSSVAWAQGPATGASGAAASQRSHFVVRCVDKDGTPVTTGSDPRAELEGPSGMVGTTVHDNGNGVYDIAPNTLPLPAGEYKLMVTVNPGMDRKLVKGVPIKLTVSDSGDISQVSDSDGAAVPMTTPAGEAKAPEADPVTSFVDGSGVGDVKGVAALSTDARVFSLHALDNSKSPITIPASQESVVELRGPNGAVPLTRREGSSGVYEYSYPMPLPHGDYTIQATLSGQPVQGTPLKFAVDHVAQPSKCVAEGPGVLDLSPADAAKLSLSNETTQNRLFVVKAVDSTGQPVTVAPSDVTVEVQGPAGAISTEVKADGTEASNLNCAYALPTPLVPGEYTVQVRVYGQPISGMPVKFIVPAVASLNQSHAEGPGLQDAAGAVALQEEPRTFTVKTLDNEGKPVTVARSDIAASVKGLDTNTEYPVEVKGATSGGDADTAFTASYTSPLPAGNYAVNVSLYGVPLKNTPHQFNVAKTANPAMSFAEGPGLETVGGNDAIADAPRPFYIRCRDNDDKPFAVGSSDVNVNMQGPAGSVSTEVKETDQCSYGVTYPSPLPAGDYSVDARLYGRRIKGMPSKFSVKAAAHPAHCKLDFGARPQALAGVPNKFQVRALNAQGQLVADQKCGVDISHQDDGSKVSADINDNKDGTFGVTWSPQKPGPHIVSVSINDTLIAGCPINVQVLRAGVARLCTKSQFAFTIWALNGDSELKTVGGDRVEAGCLSVGGESVPVVARDNENGSYTISYDVNVDTTDMSKNKWTVSFLMNGDHIPGSPWIQDLTSFRSAAT